MKLKILEMTINIATHPLLRTATETKFYTLAQVKS